MEPPPPVDIKQEEKSRNHTQSSAVSDPASPTSPNDFQRSCKTDVLLPDTIPPSNKIYLKDGPSRLALDRNKFWSIGKVLHVRFLGASSDKVKEKVKFYARKWLEFANIDLLFIESGYAEIRISFDKTDGSWSYVGTQCAAIPAHKATMNFGWFDDNTREDEFSRTTLHEFGHALGCVHEHQAAASRLNWDQANIQRVYDFFQRTNGWSQSEVDQNVLLKYSATDLESTTFDDHSIMLYPYPDYLFKDKKGTSSNCELSDTDKEFIGRIYPFRSRSIGEYSFDHANSNFNIRTMEFRPPHKKPPQIALGLCKVHMAPSSARTIGVDMEAVTADSFTLAIYSWADTRLYSAGAQWVEIEPDDQDIQIHTTLAGYATGITSSSFDLHLDTWANRLDEFIMGERSHLMRAELTWVACRHDKEGIGMGSISFDNSGIFDQPKACNSGHVFFDPQCGFSHPPRVLLAVNKLDIRRTYGLRFSASVTDITREGFRWSLDSGDDKHKLHGGGVGWIAFAGGNYRGGKTKSFEAEPGDWSEQLKAFLPSNASSVTSSP